MESKPGNATQAQSTATVRKWTKLARRTALAFVLAASASAAAQAHDIYSGLRTKDGKSCCNDSDCRPARYRVESGVQMLVDGVWVAIPPDRLQYAQIHGDHTGGAHWCGWSDPNEGLFTNCAILPPQTAKTGPHVRQLVGRFVRLDGGPPVVRKIANGVETFLTQAFPVRVSEDGRLSMCLRPDPEGDYGVTCLHLPQDSPGGP
jgi:hypothetical protein